MQCLFLTVVLLMWWFLYSGMVCVCFVTILAGTCVCSLCLSPFWPWFLCSTATCVLSCSLAHGVLMDGPMPATPSKRNRTGEDDSTGGNAIVARCQKPPCCYMHKKHLVYGAFVGRVNVLVDGVSVPQRVVTRCAYTENTFLDRTVASGVVAELEGPLMAPTPLMAVTRETRVAAYVWAPLLVGDLVVAASQRPVHETPHEALRRVAASAQHRGALFDPYDSTVPAHLVALTLFVVHRLGRLDALLLAPVSVDNIEDVLLKASVGSTVVDSRPTPMPADSDATAPCRVLRFKRSDVRKVVRFHTQEEHAVSGAPLRQTIATAERVRRMLDNRLMASGASNSALVDALSAENVRLSANGSGIGHSMHSQTPTLKEINDAFNNQ